MVSLLIASLLFKGVSTTVKNYFQSRQLWVLSFYLIIVVFSGLYSENRVEWMNWVRIKLPFLALPLAFAPLHKLDSRQFVVLLYTFILAFFISTCLVLGNYFLHFESMTNSFSQGTQIPILFKDISHIRYTLMLAFSFFCTIYLVQQKLFLFNPAERWLQLIYAAFVIVALHILSVRSGLLALYLGLLYLAVHEIIRRRQILVGGIILCCIILLPYTAYKLVPSLHNKIGYMNFDLERYQKGDINEHSDAMRLLSMKIGLQIWHESPMVGIGAGDLENESNKIYAAQYPQISDYNRRVPHNQFIWVLATTGALGLVLFLAAFFTPFLTQGYYKYGLIFILHLMLFSSFFTEDTFEEQMGCGFYLIFLLILMNYFKEE